MFHIRSFIQELGCNETHCSLFGGFLFGLVFSLGTIREGFLRLCFANVWVKGPLAVSDLLHLSVLLVNIVNHLLL